MVYGQDHALVAESYHKIGTVYDSQVKQEEALEFYQKSLEIRIRVYRHDHPHVADSKWKMDLIHEDRNEMKKAQELFQECHQIYLKAYWTDHSDTLNAAKHVEENV